MESTLLLGAACAFGSSCTWAVGVSVYSGLSQKFAPSVISATRAFLALIVFGVWLLLTPGTVFPDLSHIGWLFLSMLASYAVGDFLFLTATKKIGVPSALAIACVYPVFSSLLGSLFRAEMMSVRAIFGLVFVILGTVWIILAGQKEAQSSQSKKNFKQGVLLALCTSVFWAINTLAVAKGSEGITPQAANFVRMTVALFLCPVAGWLFGSFKETQFRWILPFSLIRKYGIIFVFEAVGGSVLYVMGLTLAPLGVASALSGLSPVIAAPVAWARGTEPVSMPKMMALVMVVAGIALMTIE